MRVLLAACVILSVLFICDSAPQRRSVEGDLLRALDKYGIKKQLKYDLQKLGGLLVGIRDMSYPTSFYHYLTNIFTI